MIAHAVDRKHALLTGGRNHKAPWTHTEAVDPTGILCLGRQRILCGFELRIQMHAAILAFIDSPLQILHAHTHSHGLGDHGESPVKKHIIGIPCAMA